MASKSKRARLAPERNYSRTFKYWAIAILAIKAIIIINIQGGVYEILGKPFLIDGIFEMKNLKELSEHENTTEFTNTYPFLDI